VDGPHNAEVPMIERGDPIETEPFGERYDAGISAAEWQIPVSGYQISNPRPIGGGRPFDQEFFIDNRGVEGEFRFGAELSVDEVGRLGSHHGRRDQRTGVGLKERCASCVVRVVLVGRRDNYASIDEWHWL
jgi:hypothetical protein